MVLRIACLEDGGFNVLVLVGREASVREDLL